LIAAADFSRESVRAEVAAQFERYESALRAHDVARLDEFFLARPDTVRYGVAEQQYGCAAIRAWRLSAAPVHPQRQLLQLVIVSYGGDCASVSAELRDPAHSGVLRQSQVWVRTAAGWKIAAAHVSLNAG
jgi:Protein of unknown function (DUF3225)